MRRSRPLDFPGDEEPDYRGFLNVSVTLAATAATADVDVTSKPMRQTVTWRTLMSYAFSTVVRALAISLLAGLFLKRELSGEAPVVASSGRVGRTPATN